MKTFRNEGGFTLIELMIVVLIIGILVAIAIPVFSNVQANAQRRACYANLRTLDGAIQSYAAANDGDYPLDAPAAKTALEGEYVQTWPVCPTGGAYTSVSGDTADMYIECADHGTYRTP